jgi:hypothetical protein
MRKYTSACGRHPNELKEATFYTHLYLAYCFWQVRVRDVDIHNTTVHTLDGLMEWAAIPFAVWNAPATFERMVNDIMLNFLQVRYVLPR